MWVNEGATRIDYSTQSEIDLTKLGQMLRDHGYISDNSLLRTLSKAQLAAYLDQRDDDLPPLVPFVKS